MRNPFEDLLKPRLENPKGEDVGGTFYCQEYGCFNIDSVANYLEEVSLLSWICSDGHINKVKDFHID